MKSNKVSSHRFGNSLTTNVAANNPEYVEVKTASKTNSNKPEFRMKKDGKGLRVIAVPSLAPEAHAKPIADFRNGLAQDLAVPAEKLWNQLVCSYDYRLYNFKEQECQLEARILADLVNLSGGEITYESVNRLIDEVVLDMEADESTCIALAKLRAA